MGLVFKYALVDAAKVAYVEVAIGDLLAAFSTALADPRFRPAQEVDRSREKVVSDGKVF